MAVETMCTQSRGRIPGRINVDIDKLRLLLCLSKELGFTRC